MIIITITTTTFIVLAQINYNIKTVDLFWSKFPVTCSYFTPQVNCSTCFYVFMLILLRHVMHDHTESSTVHLSITDQLKWPLLGIVMVPLQRASMWHGNMKVSEVTHENWWGQILVLSSGTLLKLIKDHFNVLHFCEDWVCFHLWVKWLLLMICHL